MLGLIIRSATFCRGNPLWLPPLGQAQEPAPTMADVRTKPGMFIIFDPDGRFNMNAAILCPTLGLTCR
jgi:hypothetical protein